MTAAACRILMALAAFHAVAAAAAEWHADTAASSLEFVATFEKAPAPGVFRTFDARVSLDEGQAAGGRVDVSVTLASADMANADVNREIRGPDWFDAARFPLARFRSSGVRALAGKRFVASGTLDLKGVVRPVEVPFTWSEAGDAASMEGELTLERTAFNVGVREWARTDVIGPEVKVRFRLRLRKDM